MNEIKDLLTRNNSNKNDLNSSNNSEPSPQPSPYLINNHKNKIINNTNYIITEGKNNRDANEQRKYMTLDFCTTTNNKSFDNVIYDKDCIINKKKEFNKNIPNLQKNKEIELKLNKLQQKLLEYEKSLSKTKNEYEIQISNYASQVQKYEDFFEIFIDFLGRIIKDIPDIDFNKNDFLNIDTTYSEITEKLAKIEKYILNLKQENIEYKSKYQKLLDLDSCRPLFSLNRNNNINNNIKGDKEKDFSRKQNTNNTFVDMYDNTNNSIYNSIPHPENVFENNFENYEKNSLMNNNNNLTNDQYYNKINNNNYDKENNPYSNNSYRENKNKNNSIIYDNNKFVQINNNEIYKTLEERINVLEKELLSQKNNQNQIPNFNNNSINQYQCQQFSNPYFNNNVNYYDNSNFTNKKQSFKDTIVKKRPKSNTKITSNKKERNEEIGLRNEKIENRLNRKIKQYNPFVMNDQNYNDEDYCNYNLEFERRYSKNDNNNVNRNEYNNNGTKSAKKIRKKGKKRVNVLSNGKHKGKSKNKNNHMNQ